jgi:hypothetical protein
MRLKIPMVVLFVILLLSACGSTSVWKATDSETPPLPVVIAGKIPLTVYQSSYCWSGGGKGKCADYPSPDEMLKDKPKEPITANEILTYKFEAREPSELTVTRYNNGTITQESLLGRSFRAPSDKGIYYYSLSAVWWKDKEKRITDGSSNYTFVIEVR